MKRYAALILTALLVLLSACADTDTPAPDGRLSIVCSDFPAYDFAREICGDKADILLLIKPGAELHSFEPTPKDIIRIQSCDLFICNGGESEEWTEELLDPDEPREVNIIRMMDCVETVEEEITDGMYVKGEGEEEGDEPELDEHVWTSPLNAVKIASAISDAVCQLDAENAEYYSVRTEGFTAQLTELDTAFRAAVKNASRDTLIFADRFPMRYFTLEYGLKYYAAFPGCSTETEASAKTVAFLIDRVREEDMPAVLYLEFSNERMADIICEDTGCKKLPFYSAHNITAEQYGAGCGYLDLMYQNLDSLKEALG